MGYFDAITSASFKKSAGGQLLFYPYGILGRGYVVPSEAEFEKLRRSYKYMWVVSFVLIFVVVWILLAATTTWLPFIFLPVVAIYLIAFMLWVRARCRNLAPSGEKMTYTEAISNETRGLSSRFLWVFEILSILLILYGVILLIADPSQWLLALVMIVVFAACAFVWARMIRMKQRQAQTKQ